MATTTSVPLFSETKEYEVGPGAIDLGREYEYKMVALTSLRCLLQDFVDVQIAFNAEGLGALDDLIVIAQTSQGEEIKILMQLKHEDRGKNMSKEQFLAARGNYTLLKYCEHILNLKKRLDSKSQQKGIIKELHTFDGVYFILFTNKGTNQYVFLENNGWDAIQFLNTNATNDNLYKFNLTNLPELSSLPNLDYNIFLFAKQSHVNRLDEIIETEMEKVLGHFRISSNLKILTKAYTDYVTDWSMGKLGKHYYLTKQDILYKLTELLLCQYELDLSREKFQFYDSPQKQLWNEMVCGKTITTVDADEEVIKFLKLYVGSEIRPYCQKVGQTWSNKFSNEEQSLFYTNYGNLKKGILKIIGKNGRITLLSIYKCLWFLKRLPLLLYIKTLEEFDNILEILKISNYELKVIILNEKNLKLTMRQYVSSYFSTLSDLDWENRDKILDHPVKLQGRSFVILKELLDNSLFSQINCNAIIHILMGNYNIGIEHNRPLSECFIERSLLKVFVSTDVLKQIREETFVIEIKEETNNNSLRNKLDRLISTCGTDTKIHISEEHRPIQLEELKLEEKPIHRLVFHENELLEWKESFGSTNNIQKYQIHHEIGITEHLFNVGCSLPYNTNQCYELDNILVSNNRDSWFNCVNVVSASPGMGKSTLLDYIGAIASTKMWVLNVKLIDYDGYSDEASSRKAKLTAQDHLKHFHDSIPDNHTCNDMQLVQAVFQHFVDRTQVLVLLDGLDEVSISYKNKVVEMTNCLQEAGYCVWITTRPHLARELEEEFSAITTTLKPFSLIDQQRFLTKYFTHVSDTMTGIKSNHRTLIEEFVVKLVDASRNNLNDHYNQFLGIPLQTKLLANAFTDELKHTLTTGIVKFERRFDLLHLFNEFMKGKDDILCRKLGKGARYTQSLVQEHQQLFALKLLFDNQDLFRLDIERQLKDYYYDEKKIQCLQQDGVTVIQQSMNNKKKKFQVSFLHRTFAEYLAARWLFLNFNGECQNSRLTARFYLLKRHEFFKDEYEFVFRIFDYMLAGDSQLHKLIIGGRLDEAQELIKSNPDVMEVLDEGGRSFLHLVAISGPRQMINNSNDSYEMKTEMSNFVEQIPVDNIKNTKDVLGCTPLDYALFTDSLAVANKLCEKSNKLTINTCIVDLYPKNSMLLWGGTYKPLFEKIFPLFICRCFLIDVHRIVDDESVQSYCHRKDLDYNDLNEIVNKWINGLGVTTVSELLIKLNIKSPDTEPYYYDLAFAATFGTLSNVEDLLPNRVNPNVEIFSQFYTPLYSAVKHNRLEIVKLLLYHGEKANEPYLENVTPLHCAAEYGFNDIVKELLSYNSDVNLQNDNGVTPFLMALHYQQVETAKLLLAHHANMNIKDKSNHSAVHYAAENGLDDLIPQLIRFVDINCQDLSNRTPLHNVISNRHISTIRLLLQNGADCNIPTSDGKLPLHLVAEANIYKVLPEIFSKTNDSVNVTTKYGETPLNLSIDHRCTYIPRILHNEVLFKKTVQFLLNKGASTNIQDVEGNSAMHYLCSCKIFNKSRTKSVALFLTKDTDLNLKNNNGKTPLLCFLSNIPINHNSIQFFKTFPRLITKDNINIQDIDGNTALHYLCRYFKFYKTPPKNIALFLNKIADPNLKNKKGKTPLHCFLSNVQLKNNSKQFLEMIPYLTTNYNINIQDKRGNTALHYLCKYPKIDKVLTESVVLFLNKNADLNLKNEDSETPLHCFVSNIPSMINPLTFLEIIPFLISNDNINIQDNRGNSALHYLCKYPKIDKVLTETVVLFLNKHVDVNLKNKDGKTPLHCFVSNIPSMSNPLTFLEIIPFLISNDNINIQDNRGNSALHYLCKYSKIDKVLTESVVLFWNKNADVNLKNEDGETTLHCFISNIPSMINPLPFLEIIPFLISNDNVNIQNIVGNTPLHCLLKNVSISEQIKPSATELLLLNGADVKVQNNFGENAFHLAFYLNFDGDLRVLNMLRSGISAE